MALIQTAANGSEIAIGCLTFDQPAANTFAKSSRIITVPGIEWYSESSLSMRGE
jgi:hypothetical protein